jgi:hypothetical protein
MNARRVCVIRNGKQDYIMAKAGRNRKSVERHDCGKVKQPTPMQRQAEILSVGTNNPERRPYGEHARAQWIASPVGRMIHHKKLTREQANVIERAGNIIGRYLASLPDAKINGKPPSWARFTKDDVGTEYAPQDPVDAEPLTQDERDERAKDAFDALERDLMDGGFVQNQWIITRVHILSQDIHEHEIGDLRLMANHLARVWKARRDY